MPTNSEHVCSRDRSEVVGPGVRTTRLTPTPTFLREMARNRLQHALPGLDAHVEADQCRSRDGAGVSAIASSMEMAAAMKSLLNEIRHTPLLWMLIFVPAVLVAETAAPHSHTLLFVLSVLAIVPLAALLSHATEAVAAKTGDAVGGLLNATLGNLTELIIAITALHAGQYMLVKASIAGAIVTNTLFMLGACLLIGGLRYHVQEFNRSGGRLYSGLLLMATVALFAPSAVADLDLTRAEAIMQKLSVGLAILLIVAYGLGLLFSLKTHKELFASAEHNEGEAHWTIGLAVGTLLVVTVLVALVSEIFVESVQKAAETFGMSPALSASSSSRWSAPPPSLPWPF